jgi:polysaccharide biosynthesis transport protein
MDTIDRPDPNVPARYPSESSRVPAPSAAMSYDLAVATPAAMPQVTPRVLLRGIVRHWWRIALGWLVLSVPLAYYIHQTIEPTYDAVGLLEAEPTAQSIYDHNLHPVASQTEAGPYLRTQVHLMRSDAVLDAAVAKPEISRLPMIAGSPDPKAMLRGALRVGIVGGDTFLIEVGLTSKIPSEAAAIINAVVDEFITQHRDYQQTANRTLKKDLEFEKEKLKGEIGDLRNRLQGLIGTGNVSIRDVMAVNKNAKEDDPSSFEKVDDSEYRKVLDRLMDTDLAIVEARGLLATTKDQFAAAQQLASAEGGGQARLQAELLEERIREEFTSNDPDAQRLIEQINVINEALQRHKDLARNQNDPAIQAAWRQHDKLKKQWERLWEIKHDKIKERLEAGAEDQRPQAWAARIHQIEQTIQQHEGKKESLRQMIAALKTNETKQNSSALELTFLNDDLNQRRSLHAVIESKLKQLQFEMATESYRITVRNHADIPKVPSANKRMKYLAMAPAGVLCLMLGLFLLLEIKSERVGDPEALSTRVQSEVYALPPLPTGRSIRKRVDPNDDDQIEQFIQRLDHLRFAVCGNPAELEKGRCVLITSAIGGEGKTTLAAQLAARCGNAGMSTLLIDADLRRTGLCALLDIPEGPGLSDALLNDEPPPTELVVPVQGGTFHLLGAGTPIPDTSRIFQNRKLGLLIAQFRQLYDLVIIDSPPVLPVPDALVLGRWVDGAVLAVRYDISRFPQVERARKQLDGAGIAVLGTVINGMKNADSYYGRYSYSRKRSPHPETPAAY